MKFLNVKCTKLQFILHIVKMAEIIKQQKVDNKVKNQAKSLTNMSHITIPS